MAEVINSQLLGYTLEQSNFESNRLAYENKSAKIFDEEIHTCRGETQNANTNANGMNLLYKSNEWKVT